MDTTLLCLTCHKTYARSRGICYRCWVRHNAAVRRGETTWSDLERQGLARPPRRGQAWRGSFGKTGD